MLNKKKKPTYSQSKKKAWAAFSIYVRTRDCVESTGTLDKGKCFTCEKVYDFKQLQAGHFIQGRHNHNLFDERGCYAQCYHCNVGLKGNVIVYYEKLERLYGKELIKDLQKKEKILKKYKVFELQELEKFFIYKTKELYEKKA